MPTAVYNRTERIHIIDGLRGIAIIYVVLYHLLYDLVYILGADIPFWGSDWFENIHTGVLILLFAVSGISTSFSRNVFRRGAILLVIGFIITLVTAVVPPLPNIVFGVISCFGASMLLYGVLQPFLDRLPWELMFIISALIYVMTMDFVGGVINLFFTELHLPDRLYETAYLYPIGIRGEGFYSADYFPLIPWFFIFLCGAALSKPIQAERLPRRFYSMRMPLLDSIGRHTLIIYIVHQPIIYGAVYAAARLRGE